METDDYPNFCAACGAPLRDSDSFCTKCGTLKGESTPKYSQQHPQYGSAQKSGNMLVILGVLSLIWAAVALLFGLYCIINADFLAEEVAIAIYEYDPELVFDAYLYVLMMGVIAAASGALSLVTGILCIMKKAYTVALITCILASALVIIPFGFIGLIVAFFIYKSKYGFKVKGSTV